jgi:hypothetical protein
MATGTTRMLISSTGRSQKDNWGGWYYEDHDEDALSRSTKLSKDPREGYGDSADENVF